jgi:hypothetical protein
MAGADVYKSSFRAAQAQFKGRITAMSKSFAGIETVLRVQHMARTYVQDCEGWQLFAIV